MTQQSREKLDPQKLNPKAQKTENPAWDSNHRADAKRDACTKTEFLQAQIPTNILKKRPSKHS